MATIAQRTVPGLGKRMLLVGAAGLLLGGVAGGLVDRALQSEEASPPVVESSAPVVPGGQAVDIEAIRARNFTTRHRAPVTDIEAVRARSFETTAAQS
jgi:hypothetical protein